jgi:2,5-dihydroxypyridine 5,6-dioxygenase
MSPQSGHLSKLVEDMLVLNKVQEGEKVVVIVPTLFDQRYVEAYSIALSNLNADFFFMTLVPQADGHRLILPTSDFVYDTLMGADLLVTLSLYKYDMAAPSMFYLVYGSEKGYKLMASGTRVLSVMEEEEVMRRMFPTSDLVERSYAGAELLEQAEEIHVSSEAGTNLLCCKKGRPASCEVGIADVPGRWDNFGYGLVGCAPWENSAHGVLVIDRGDYIMPLYSHVTEPIHCTIREGRIVKIEGGTSARLLQRWLVQWDSEKSYGLSHIGWGTHTAARWFDRRTRLPSYHIEKYCYYGNMAIAFGNNLMKSPAKYCGLHGANDAPSHCDIFTLNHDFDVDGVPIVRRGEIVHPDCR